MRRSLGQFPAATPCCLHALLLALLCSAGAAQSQGCAAEPGAATGCSSATVGQAGPVSDHVLLQRGVRRFKSDAGTKSDESAMPGPRVRVHIHTHIFGHRAHIRPDSSTRHKKISCRKPIYATDYDAEQACPVDCPFWAEDTDGKSKPCRFQCVAASECGLLVANATIADKEGMNCRKCMVPSCAECVHIKPVGNREVTKSKLQEYIDIFMAAINGNNVLPEEQCVKCSNGYDLIRGRCRTRKFWMWWFFFCLIGLTLLFISCWYVHLLLFRPVVNLDGLEHGEKFRSRTRLHMYGDDEAQRQLWPLTTNLCKEDHVAGPGLSLFFCYARHVIMWSFLVGAGWGITALFINTDLIVVGLRGASTPQQMCSVIKWGHKFQHLTMWVKVIFIFFVYIGTFIASVVHAAFQMCRFQSWDDETTMRDFAAFCVGIPAGFNSDTAETELAACLQAATGEKIVGVSICWSFKAQSKRVREISERDMEASAVRHRSSTMSASSVATSNPPLEDDRLTKAFKQIDAFLGFVSPEKRKGRHSVQAAQSRTQSEERQGAAGAAEQRLPARRERPHSPRPLAKWWGGAPHSPRSTTQAALQDCMDMAAAKQDERSLLRSIETAGYAIAVFETEESRDIAVEKAQLSQGVQLGDTRVQLKAVDWEPDTMIYKHFAWARSWSLILLRIVLGVLCIVGCLALWAACFYLPYAYYTLSFSYARGETPGLFANGVFTLLVVAGNQIMYFLCSEVTHRIRFFCQDTFEFTYMVLYTFACMINLVFDLVVTYYTTYVTMIGMNVYTFDGRHLDELTTLELFMSYPMQRALGHQLFWYAFPSCFLMPFVFEPLFATHLPHHIARLIVRSDTNFQGYHAEMALRFWCPMDLSRYADIILNVCIAATSLFFPGGYVLQTFGSLFFSHIYVYAYDHYRVLREIPGLVLGSNIVDRAVNILMAFPCCILLACLIFKMHSLPEYDEVPKGTVAWQIIFACLAHTAVHIFILCCVLPLCGRRHHRTTSSYAEAARRLPCSWFNANPVHCLRSKYLHHHKPPFIRFARGKEHLQAVNPTIGAYYEGGVGSQANLQAVRGSGSQPAEGQPAEQ